MSRIYDNWEKLVGAVLNREELRRLALSESFSTSVSTNLSSRPSFDSDIHADADLCNGSKFPFHTSVVAIEYEELKKATRSFQPFATLGLGGFDHAYKGWIDGINHTTVTPGCGTAVSVRKLSNARYLEHNEWVDKINYLGQIRHPNLVKLIGYSFERDMRFLVHEFMPKGSLDNHLFIREHGWTFPWATRIKVATGTARALAFLHNLEMPVIYQDLSSHQILLDGDFNAKLRDFSLVKKDFLFEVDTTRAADTYGYSAPEYLATGRSSTECDVYSFGIVLVDLITGCRALDRNRPTGEHILIDWAKPYLRKKRRLPQIMDGRFKGEYPLKAAYQVAQLALQCVTSNASFRPRMVEVVATLEKLS